MSVWISQRSATINHTKEEPVILTARNDGMINSFNPIQLSAWRANVDMQFIVSRHKVVQYCTKYVTKSEPRSQSLKDTFANITRTLKEGDRTVKAVQKLLINSRREGLFSTENLSPTVTTPHVQSIKEFHHSQSGWLKSCPSQCTRGRESNSSFCVGSLYTTSFYSTLQFHHSLRLHLSVHHA